MATPGSESSALLEYHSDYGSESEESLIFHCDCSDAESVASEEEEEEDEINCPRAP